MKDIKKAGAKFDEGKLRMNLITPEMMVALATVLGHGAEKYGERNFENGLKFSRLFAATLRHLWKWWSGESIDESGHSHLWHAFCSLGILVTLEYRGSSSFNDRSIIKYNKEA